MAGHSHWSKIKRAKGTVDARRGKVWSKVARKIIIAAKSGGDPSANLTLRYAIDEAKAVNMPKDTIEKAIKKGTGELASEQFESIVYEGYAPGGVAVLCNILTDNRNRTAGEVRKIFEQRGGSLGSTNCVAYLFQNKGLITVNVSDTDEEKLLELVLDAGADDLQKVDNLFEITCDPAHFEAVKQNLVDHTVPLQICELTMIPDNQVQLEPATTSKVMALVDALEDHDDVQNVYANLDAPVDE